MMRLAPGAGGQRVGLSRKERIGLLLHRGLDRWLSPFGVWVFRRTKGAVARPWRVHALLLTTHGRRSGRERTVVLQYVPDGDAMVIAAANDGGRSHPGWYFNLSADPRATVEIEGQTIRVSAFELAGDEARECWERILEASPGYERYARATARRIPVIRLVPDGAGT